MLKKLKLNGFMNTYKTFWNYHPKKMSFSLQRTGMQSRKSRDTWSNRQVWPCSTKGSRAKVKRVLQENALVPANTLFQQHKRRLYTWTSPDGQYRNQIDYVLCSQKWRHSIQSVKIRPGADCGSDHQLLIAKFRLKLKKVRENHQVIQFSSVTQSCPTL